MYFSVFTYHNNVKMLFQKFWSKIRNTDCITCFTFLTNYHGGLVSVPQGGTNMADPYPVL